MRKWDLLKSDGTSARFPHLYHDVTERNLQVRQIIKADLRIIFCPFLCI